MVLRREQFVNHVLTTLNGAINDTVISLTLTDASLLPLTGDCRLRLVEEVVLMTARTGDVLVVERGVDGTTAVSHPDEIAVSTVVTRDGIKKYIDDITAGASSREPMRILDKFNTILTASDFTFVNQASSSVFDDAGGGITMINAETGAVGFKMLAKAAPATPYTVRGKILLGPGWDEGTSGTLGGIFFRESSTSKFMMTIFEPGDIMIPGKWTDENTFNSFFGTSVTCDNYWVWHEIEDDGVDLKFRVSLDGINYTQLGSESRTTFMAGGPNEIGFACSSRGRPNKLMHLKAWREF